MLFANDGFYSDAERKRFDLERRKRILMNARRSSNMTLIWDNHIDAISQKIQDCIQYIANEQDDGQIRRIV
jgi:hypothetical protein